MSYSIDLANINLGFLSIDFFNVNPTKAKQIRSSLSSGRSKLNKKISDMVGKVKSDKKRLPSKSYKNSKTDRQDRLTDKM
jgi:hypothetical protein